MKPIHIIIAICSLLFLMIGIDKFYAFMEPPCSLTDNISPAIWKSLGALQIISSIALWFPKPRKYIAGFFFVFMLIFSLVHLTQQTYDIGGAVFMAALLGLLVWNPRFLNKRLF